MISREIMKKVGCTLNHGATSNEISNLKKFLGFDVDEVILNLYSEFNGFSGLSVHEPSQIHVWSIEEILLDSESYSKFGLHRPFADEFICADTFLCNFSNASDPIIRFNDESIIAESWSAFWNNLVSGSYDNW